MDSRLPEPDVPNGGARAGRVRALRDLIGGIALDRVNRAGRGDVLDHADVLVRDDQIAGLRLDVAARVRNRLPGLLRPGVHVVDAAEALTAVTQRDARLARGPRGEVRAPRANPRAGRGLAKLCDAGRVVGAGRLLLDTDFLRDEVDDGLPRARGRLYGGRAGQGSRPRVLKRGREACGRLRGCGAGGGGHGRGGSCGGGEQRLQLCDPGEGDVIAHAWSASTLLHLNLRS